MFNNGFPEREMEQGEAAPVDDSWWEFDTSTEGKLIVEAFDLAGNCTKHEMSGLLRPLATRRGGSQHLHLRCRCRCDGNPSSGIMPPMSPLRTAVRFFAKLWTRDSSILLGGFFVTIFLIIYVWWPLAVDYFKYVDWNSAWWHYMDWLLLGIFGFMSVTIIARADLKTDLLIVFVGMCGGLAIESWGTQTNLWHYYTAERPPLWIIPAWPIASLSIDRITRALDWTVDRTTRKSTALQSLFSILYWITFASFLSLMLIFVAPTFDKSFTWLALILCLLLILTPTDYRFALLTFIAGSGLGYYLEVWGTTRECWIYYTRETPPVFAVLAHGMAAVAFWRAGLILKLLTSKLPRKSSMTAQEKVNP